MSNLTIYKGFRITYEPKPIPLSCFDYDWYSPESGDGGSGSTVEDCKSQIDEILEHISSGCPDPTERKA